MGIRRFLLSCAPLASYTVARHGANLAVGGILRVPWQAAHAMHDPIHQPHEAAPQHTRTLPGRRATQLSASDVVASCLCVRVPSPCCNASWSQCSQSQRAWQHLRALTMAKRL